MEFEAFLLCFSGICSLCRTKKQASGASSHRSSDGRRDLF
jgi:hypothetical protein